MKFLKIERLSFLFIFYIVCLVKNKIPEKWRWDNYDGINLLTIVRNQNSPRPCNSDWALAATSALSDRIKIIKKGKGVDIVLSPQLLLSCNSENYGCEKGEAKLAYKYIKEKYITEESCNSYTARGYSNGKECRKISQCMRCNYEFCRVADSYRIFKIEDYGTVTGEEDMKEEIYKRGPIVCKMKFPDELIELDNTKASEVFIPEKNEGRIIEVEVIGYDELNGLKYWVIKNSLGTFWGDLGYFKLLRGDNSLGIEEDCTYAIPKDTWTDNIRHNTTEDEKEKVKINFVTYNHTDDEEHPDENTEIIKSELPINLIDISLLPETYDWRNVNGTNWVSYVKNQHSPQPCGVCWIFAPTSALADRIQIMYNLTRPVSISTQYILNARPNNGSCDGGNDLSVYKYIYKNGITDDSCLNYVASDKYNGNSPLNTCHICYGDIPKKNKSGRKKCKPVKNPVKYFISEYGKVSGVDNMKAEIFMRGPISCAIAFDEAFNKYKGGIIEVDKKYKMTDHIISLIGWGIEDDKEFWIGRNSWGTSWGEDGFFRIAMNKNTLLIESYCKFAVPSINKPNIKKNNLKSKINK